MGTGRRGFRDVAVESGFAFLLFLARIALAPELSDSLVRIELEID
jgi:hypothetical protein